jgi:hypothetical protein
MNLSLAVMNSDRMHSINILETPFSTVTSNGHWFHATRETIRDYVPGLMKIYTFEDLISKAVTWIDSADSLAMIFFFVLAFLINPWIAAVVVLVFHYMWYHQKSAFVNIAATPFLKLINRDFFQLLTAAVVLSFMGISGMYTAVIAGIVLFFLFKIGLLRRLWDKLDVNRNNGKLPLNDRTLKMVLVRYSMYQNIPPREIEKIDKHVQQAIIDYNRKKKK